LKKFLIIALSAVFVLGLAASAFAIHAEIPSETQAVVAKGETQITLGGSIRVRGEIRDADFTETTDTLSWYDQRVRLSVAAKVSDDVSGLVVLETSDQERKPSADGWQWGANDAATGVYWKGNAKPTGLGIIQAWIDYKNDFVNLKVGHMPLALGNKLFFDHRKFGDDAIVLYKDVDSTHLAAIAIKLDESSSAISDDADAYVALFAHKGDGFNVSGDVTWVNDDAFPAAGKADLYNIGLRGDTTVGGIKLKGDIEIQTGDTDAGGAFPISNLCGTADCDFSGYALMGSATVDLDSMTVGVEVGYGSGDDNPGDDEFEMFVTSLSSGVPYIAFVHGTRTGTNNPTIGTTGALTSNGISNLTYIKGSVSGSLADNLTGKADLIWLTASEDNPAGEDEIGLEIDGKITYKVAKNLVYWIEGGILFADDYYMVNADDAYALRHGIELSF
jgi:hypothetical protein